MDQPITIKDIARICGCGVSTVSRALNNHPDINPEIVRAIIYDTLQSRDIDFNSVQITCAAGAGAVS